MIITDTDRILGTGGTPSVEIPTGTRYSAGVLFDGRTEAALAGRIVTMNRALFGDLSANQGVLVFDGNARAASQHSKPQTEVTLTALERPQLSFRRSQGLTPRLRG